MKIGSAISTDLKAVFVSGNTFGSLDSANLGSSDGYLRRYNRNGSLAWGVQFGSADEDTVIGLALDTRNRVYVAGSAQDYDTFVPHGFLEQYTAGGKLVWHRDISRKFGEYTVVFGVTTDASDNVLVIGIGSTGTNGSYGFVSKYSSRGSLVWSKIYEGQSFFKVITDQSGNIYMLDFYANVRKLSSSGRLVWDKDLSKTPNVGLDDLRVVGDALYVTGSKSWEIDDDTPPESDAYVAKFNLAGNLIWAKSFGTKVPDAAYAVTADSRGNVYVTGSTVGGLVGKNAGENDVIIRKYNRSGGVVWTRQFGSSKDDFGYNIAAFSPNELYVGGTVTKRDPGTGTLNPDYDAFLTRFDGNGKHIWTR